MARPSKLTPETHNKIVKAIKLGATYELAASYGGVTYDTLNNWRKRGEEESLRRSEKGDRQTKQWLQEEPFFKFFEDIKAAEGQGAFNWLSQIEKAANSGNWQAAAWKLERRYPEVYGRQRIEHTGADGGAIETKATVTIVLPHNGRQ